MLFSGYAVCSLVHLVDNNWPLGALCYSPVMQFVRWCTCMVNWLLVALCYSQVMQFVAGAPA